MLQEQGLLSSADYSQLFRIILLFGLAISIVDYGYMLWLHWKMPPGPLPLPIIGNTHQLPDNKPWLLFEKLAQDYKTPIITFWIGRNPTVWINDAWAASDLLDRRANIYCSRPRMIVFAELGSGQDNVVNMYYGERWRVHRRIMHQNIGIQQVKKHGAFQNLESKVVAFDLLTSPEEYVSHFERYATSVVSIIGFGRRVSSSQDPIITEVIAVMHKAADLNVPGKTFPMMIETFPVLAKVPEKWAPWRKGLGDRRRKGGHYFFHSLADEANRREGHEDSYVKKVFKEQPKYNLRPEEISALTGNLFGAGADTSASTLITFVLACCAFPEMMKPAWEELDRVVGPYRSPSFDDEKNLPYVRAFVKEVFRWRSVAIIGGQPHAPIQDDYYKGWYIPKNTWVQGNVWAIHHNEREFPDPDRFNPGRFLEGSKDHRPFPAEKGYMTFGWGRRVCSGQALAEQGTYITIARILWGFNIRKARDKQGTEIPVDIFKYTNGLNMRPEPFKCQFVPRSEEIRETIEREGRAALDELQIYEGTTEYKMSDFYKK
ncbi:putative cytochrome P450 [Patellaria atrata CBS 101060]|uniref:Cytochrome P450 n=1 Tax=Patellaria atrata CBS 101060 TaxID=1346257 RepID=A0A9P4VM35_9PEZI|nr:putative cytochrome P450 [Patellaria atrata CBS 101060]